MNLDKIVKECPRAWEECIAWLWRRYVGVVSRPKQLIQSIRVNFYKDLNQIILLPPDGCSPIITPDCRVLYDYFDSVGIIISVYYDIDAGWCYEVVYNNECDRERWYESRQDVEFEAIPKAFEIREQQLNNNK